MKLLIILTLFAISVQAQKPRTYKSKSGETFAFYRKDTTVAFAGNFKLNTKTKKVDRVKPPQGNRTPEDLFWDEVSIRKQIQYYERWSQIRGHDAFNLLHKL